MIKISLDESYVFDLLSIYEVKIDYSTDLDKKTKLQQSYDLLKSEITDTIGNKLVVDILASDEYAQLKQSNQIVFELVDRANETELSKLTADANYMRYLNKVSLQNKFFNTIVTEVKI
jgi:hypothetical protein